MKKTLSLLLSAVLLASVLAGCGSEPQPDSTDAPAAGNEGNPPAASATMSGPITIVSREDGSGTRGAFIELFGIEEKDANGNKTDRTTEEAIIATKTDVVLTNVAGDEAAIGYISLGSLNDTVKALKIDGAEATAENVKSGAYKIARPFHIATAGEPSGVAKDFIGFILSAEGQAVVSEGYIAVNDAAEPFSSDGSTGTITVGGSSSVAPVMEKLIEAYHAVNTGAKVEMQASDSTAGMTGAMDGTFAIGMASRDLKDAEKTTLIPTVIAQDGIAIIVNQSNTLSDMTSAQVQSIYTGEITDWEDLG